MHVHCLKRVLSMLWGSGLVLIKSGPGVGRRHLQSITEIVWLYFLKHRGLLRDPSHLFRQRGQQLPLISAKGQFTHNALQATTAYHLFLYHSKRTLVKLSFAWHYLDLHQVVNIPEIHAYDSVWKSINFCM